MKIPKEFGIRKDNVEYVERIGAYGIAVKGNSVLIEIAKLGYFLPGGGVDKGETIEEALKREFLEETGYELTSYTNLGTAVEYVEIPGKDYHMKKIQHFFLVELGAKGEPTYEDGHVYPVEWIPVDEIKEKMYLESQWYVIEQALKSTSFT